MHKLVDFLSSPTFGFLLKLFSGIAAAAFGVLGIGTKTRNDSGSLTRDGKIALIGILMSAAIGGAATIYDFHSNQVGAAEAKRKSDQLLITVENGLFPIRGLWGSITIQIPSDLPGMDFYLRTLKSYSVKLQKGDCAREHRNPCRISTMDKVDWGINGESGMFPQKFTIPRAVMDKLSFSLAFVLRMEKGREKYKVAAASAFPIDNSDLKGQILDYSTADKSWEYSIPHFNIPDELAAKFGVYSLISLFPGYLSTEITTGIPDHLLKNQKIVLKHLIIHFPYPKVIRFDAESAEVCNLRDNTQSLLVALPDDIDKLSYVGKIYGPQPSKMDFSQVCGVINDWETPKPKPDSH